MIRAVRNLLALSVLALLALPAAAMADPVSDCAQDGDLDKQYSDRELRKGLDNIPGELEEYSTCRETISGAIKGGSDQGGGRPSTGADGSSVPAGEAGARDKDSSDLAAITGDPDSNPPSVEVAGEEVEPGSNGLFDLASASNDLPVPLIVALAALALLTLVAALVALRDRVPILGRIPLLSKIPTLRVPFPPFRR